jgi:hypothetical protein
MAEKALGQGLTVCIYDPLTWYWKTIPAVVRDVDLYIAQNFFGVEERLKSAEFAAANCQTVAPIVGQQPDNQSNGKADSTKDLVLVNLGGLSNPLWTGNEALTYARQILEAVLPTLAGQKVVVAANSAISAALAHLGAKNLSREQMQVVLQQAKYALMTPGLGNIYDAARFDTPTIWLPPANDSQGQQLALLNQAAWWTALSTGTRFCQSAPSTTAPTKVLFSKLRRPRAGAKLEESKDPLGQIAAPTDQSLAAKQPPNGTRRAVRLRWRSACRRTGLSAKLRSNQYSSQSPSKPKGGTKCLAPNISISCGCLVHCKFCSTCPSRSSLTRRRVCC